MITFSSWEYVSLMEIWLRGSLKKSLVESLIGTFLGEELPSCILHFLFLHLLMLHSHGIIIESKFTVTESSLNATKEEFSSGTKLLRSSYLRTNRFNLFLKMFSPRLFLLRDSQSNPKAFVLTLCHHQKIKHFQILPVSRLFLILVTKHEILNHKLLPTFEETSY